jgi:hypothetical protein
MARRNVIDYERVLSVLKLQTLEKGWLRNIIDIESVVCSRYDKVRSITILTHSEQMCRLIFFQKRKVSI